jgi:hypothetical protein
VRRKEDQNTKRRPPPRAIVEIITRGHIANTNEKPHTKKIALMINGNPLLFGI